MNRRTISAVLVGVLLLSSVFGLVAANETEPIHPYNETDLGENDGWMVGVDDPTLENILTLLLRVPGFLILGGSTNEIVTAILVGGIVLGSVGMNRIGFAAGGFAFAISAMAITAIGLGPQWVDAAVVMLIGLFVAVVYLRFR